MNKNPLLYASFVSIVLLAVLHFIAIEFYFYWSLWWYDYLTHFLGGLSVGLFFLSFVKEVSNRKIFLCLVVVMIIGGVWEIFEYLNGLTQSTEGYTLDIVHDLIADFAGAVFATFLRPRQSV